MQRLCDLNDIPNFGSKGFQVGEDNVFAVRQQHKVYVYRNRCPHLGIPLEWVPDRFLTSEGELIQCSSHGALFTINDGHCVAGPCAGSALEAITCEVRDKQVWVRAH